MSLNHEKVVSGFLCDKDLAKIKEAVCIQVEKIYDSCKEKDCIEDARVIFKEHHKIKCLINKAINVKAKKAEVLDVYADIEPVPFKRGFFTVDVKFFIKVTLDFFVLAKHGGLKIIPVPGLVVFDKKVVLFGSEGQVKIFKSKFEEKHHSGHHANSSLQQDNLPIAKVEVAEPIALNAKIENLMERQFDDCSAEHMPANVTECLEDNSIDLSDVLEESGEERHHIERNAVLATIGLFSIIKLARFVQLLIPAFDFCVPNKKCIASTEENPCEIFETIEFPIDEFFPPQKGDFPGAVEEERQMLEEMDK